MGLAVDWVDAFSDRPFGGNGCAVVHDAAQLSDDTCRAFVRETSLVECTFVEASEIADFRVRYFVAAREIPFAGHPTIATVASLNVRKLLQDGAVRLETGAGVIPVTIADNGTITMVQNAPVFGARPDPARVAAAVGLSVDDLAAPPQVVSTGLPFCITLLGSRAALDAARLDLGALQALADHLGHGSLHDTEPFLVTLGGATQAGQTFSRLLLAPPSPPEDPFTGSATGAMASYLWHHGFLEHPEFVAEQGHGLGRPGQARVTVLGPRDAISGVRIGGKAHVLMSGTLFL